MRLSVFTNKIFVRNRKDILSVFFTDNVVLEVYDKSRLKKENCISIFSQ